MTWILSHWVPVVLAVAFGAVLYLLSYLYNSHAGEQKVFDAAEFGRLVFLTTLLAFMLGVRVSTTIENPGHRTVSSYVALASLAFCLLLALRELFKPTRLQHG